MQLAVVSASSVWAPDFPLGHFGQVGIKPVSLAATAPAPSAASCLAPGRWPAVGPAGPWLLVVTRPVTLEEGIGVFAAAPGQLGAVALPAEG